MKASQLVQIDPNSDLSTLQLCGAYYQCPKDENGKRLGPLVGYAKRYETEAGESKQYVGELYHNHSMLDMYPQVIDYFSQKLAARITAQYGEVDYVVGPAMGGIIIGQNLSRHLDCLFAYAEKKVVAMATATEREKEILVLKRHRIVGPAKVVLVEDLCNNFSTTGELIQLVEGLGTQVVGIAVITNASGKTSYQESDRHLPLVSLITNPIHNYQQDDPAVREDIKKGNVVWKPKHEWERLQKTMH